MLDVMGRTVTVFAAWLFASLLTISTGRRLPISAPITGSDRRNILHRLGTAPGILYALLVVAKRSANASVVIFPSDHYVADDDRFMQHVDSAFDATLRHPETPIILGVRPLRSRTRLRLDRTGYANLEWRGASRLRISGFWEKTPLHIARELFRRACLLNTFIVVGTV